MRYPVKLATFVLFLLIVCSGSALAQLVQNYEENSKALKGWQVPSNLNEKYTVSLDRSSRHGGRASALLWAREPMITKTNRNLFLKQVFKADKYLNKRVRFSLFIMTENVQGANIFMRMEGKNMITLNDDRFNEWNAIRGTSNWQKYELVMDVPSQSKDIAFGIILSNAGEVWVDDIAFEVVSESTELTSTRTPEMIEASSITDVEKFKTAYKYAYKEEVEFRSARLNSLPLAPVNLDFEN